MRDDITPTNPAPIEVASAQLEAFRKDPSDGELFYELRAHLRAGGQPELLAESCELRAPYEGDRLKAASIWSEAGEARLLVGDEDIGERDLREALALDPANERAVARMTERLMVTERFAEAAAFMEAELDELGLRAEEAGAHNGDGDHRLTARRSHRHRMLAELWDERLARIDRALHHWQRAWQLEPERTDALEAARAIYASLGNEAMVTRLYEAELEVLGDRGPRARRAALELEIGRLMVRQGDPMAAAGHLEMALRLDPSSTAAREALADVYSSPAFAGKPERQRRASDLFVELGARRLEEGSEEEGIRYLRRALGVDPYSAAAADTLEQALTDGERWEELERLYLHRADLAETEEERVELLEKRAAVYETQLDDPEALKECLAELAAAFPPRSDYSMRLRSLCRDSESWRELVALIERDVALLDNDPPRLIEDLLELALIAREHLGERDRAAEHLHRVLTIEPRHPEALARYGDHFRERRDWRGLADLIEFAIDNGREAGASAAETVRQLEELAQVCEVRLGDVDRATQTWQRIQALEPENAKAQQALRRLSSRAKMWESLVGMLEQEAEGAKSPQERAEALRRIAQTYRERQVNPHRAIALYEEVLTLFPDDEGVLKALVDLYDREGDDSGVAATIRRQLELDAKRLRAELGTRQGGRPPTAREWPVAKRVERLTALRRLATMYEQRLADVEGVVFACSGILEILPGDRDALDRMERVLEKAGDVARLEQTLEYHAASATGPAERSKVLRRLARLASGRDDEVAAMERWEQVLKAAPNDADALAALAELYDRHGRWEELAQVLERTLMAAAAPAPGTPQAAKRAAEHKRHAEVVDAKLGDTARATRAWQRVLELLPKERDALDALARLHQAHGQWRDLADILARQIPLYLDDDPERAAAFALQRAGILEERLGAAAEAIRALESLLRDVDPSNLDAHAALRRLYEARGEFHAAVRIAEREMYLSDDHEQTIARGLEIGLLCRDRLGDPARALQAFERVLEIAPDHEQALTAAAELYARVGDWRRYVQTLQRRIELASGAREKRDLMMQVARATAERLGDHREAFRWYRRAHEHDPDATTLAELRRAAEAYGLWRELADVYEGERRALAGDGRPADVDAYIAACRELAAIAERRLGDRARAMAAIRDALVARPDADDLLAEAERIATDADELPLWKLLLECIAQPLASAGRAGRVALHTRRARILEERLEDTSGAVEELLRAFSWAPDQDDTRRALYDLAERTRRWEDVVAVEAALYQRAARTDRRVAILRRKAQVIEDKLHERVRAFRAHLTAFLLAPDDGDTVAHLWRLARAIEHYREAERTPRPEPPAAHVEDRDPVSAAASRPEPVKIASTRPRREETQEISLSDLIVTTEAAARASGGESAQGEATGEIPPPGRQDRTMPIDLADMVPAGDLEVGDRSDPTIELRTEDLIQALAIPRRKGRGDTPTPPPPRESGARRGPPPPPPPVPHISRQTSAPGPRRESPAPRRATPGGLALPVRAYDSPWEEFATAYEILPAPAPVAKRRWLFLAAEVWETGAEDVDRAFDTLARALDLGPDDPEPKARLHRLAAEHGTWDRLAALYETAAEEADTAEAATEMLMQVAEIRAQQERPTETESIYRRVLGMRPEETAAREKLEALYRREKRWVDLAASLEERTDPRLGAAAPTAERPALLRDLASIYRDKLSRPHDAVDALERLRHLVPEDVSVLEDLAGLYTQVGRWSKVVEMLMRVNDVADGTNQAREALRRIGRIYEDELELPDRAIDAYSQLVAGWPDDPDAHAALDRLYEAHARWEDLAETLRRRAALSRAPAERAELLRRRAHVLLEWLDSPDEAAAALRHARTILPDDNALAEALVVALVAAGREREAAAVLEGRITALTEARASEGDIAALLIRLAALRAEHLQDPDGARQALDKALALVPDHPTALATLARLAEAEENPRAFADAKLRQARVLDDVDEVVAALMEAGVALRDQVDDMDGARAAFEEVLSRRPYHPDATWALAGLVERGGNLASAAKLLENQLEDESLSPPDRARILTQLAALSREAGVEPAAERRLEEALAVCPDHLPAVIAKVDLLGGRERWDEVETFLREMLPVLDGAEPAARAELRRRLAIACDKLERPDEAYQTLIEADRLHRGNLLVKLALGENRYRARRWREAGLHLGSLAAHPEAEQYPAEVAEGLYHAALAEIRSLRPEKAEALYERALELKPNYAPALHALAERAMERGDALHAADLLTQQAEATDAPAERLKLFEALGDMALMTLKDEARAKACYEKAVAAAEPLESKHLPLLEKLLERQDLAGDHAGRGRTAELMASFAAEAGARAARLVGAAEAYAAAGDSARARAAALRAVEADPGDIDAVTVASELAMAAGDHEATAAMLGRALSGRDTPDELTAARYAQLWYRLGAARHGRGDRKGAITAFVKALETAAESDGAMAARRKLIELWGDDRDHRDEVIEFRRTLAADGVELGDVVDYARALCSAGDGDGGRAALELAAELEHVLSDRERAFLAGHPLRQMAEDEAYRGTVTAAERAALIADDDDVPLAEILATVWEAAALLWSEPAEALARCGVTDAFRIAATTSTAAAAMFTRVATALDIPATVLYETGAAEAPDVQVVCVSPPIVVLGPRMLGQGGTAPEHAELRFQLGRAAELCRPERIIAAGLPPDELKALVGSLVRVFGKAGRRNVADPTSGDGGDADDDVRRARDEMLKKALPVKLRTRLGELLAPLAGREPAPETFLAACERAADRAGLLMCGDIAAASRLARGRSGPIGRTQRHLAELALAPSYLSLRKRLGVRVS